MTSPVQRPNAPAIPSWSLYTAWQRWGFLTLLFVVTVSNYFDYFILSVLLDPIKKEFQVSDTMLGLLSGFCFALLYGIAALPIARWADRGNRRTVITFALAGWSVMTALCGLAQSFWQLALARLGVGAVEPGALPPAQSLIADYFPPERRATAISILTQGGSCVGYLVGVSLGGYIAATYGWRMAFLCAGIPGIALAVLIRVFLAEPRVQLGFPASVETESLAQTFGQLKRKPSFIWALIGIATFTLFSFGLGIFLPSFMIRTLHASLIQVSVSWGLAISAANLIGAVVGGLSADRLSRRDIRWYAWLPAVGCVLGIPFYILALTSHELSKFIAFDFTAELLSSGGTAAAFAAIHSVCGHSRRAMATAIVLFSVNFLGSGLGPLIAGVLSDAYGAVYGLQGLRYSLITLVVFLIPAAAAFYWAGRAMPRDLED
jgi:MFS family permease